MKLDLYFYRNFNIDLASLNDEQLLNHFKNHGKYENRIINKKSFDERYVNFDVNFYGRFYEDLSNFSNFELKMHYHIHGRNEGRICNEKEYMRLYPEFNLGFYREFNKDLVSMSLINLLIHYHNLGRYEGRVCSEESFMKLYPNFDEKFYGGIHSDLSRMGKLELMSHYHFYGRFEGRNYNKDSREGVLVGFDLDYYRFFHKDLEGMSDIDLINHYIIHGRNEPRVWSEGRFMELYPNFSVGNYRRCNDDLHFLNDMELVRHYFQVGINENRLFERNGIDFIDDCRFGQTYGDFDCQWYRHFNNFNLSDENLRLHYHNRGRGLNERYLNYDYDVRELESLPGHLINIVGGVTGIDYLKNVFNNSTKFYIYNRESFFKLYEDFDVDYYRGRYHSGSGISEFDMLLDFHRNGRDRVTNGRTKVIVYTEFFSRNCGGMMVLHNLVKKINELNDGRVYAKILAPCGVRYRNEFCENFATPFEINENTVVVYPEIVRGNYLNCRKVVRWLLQELGYYSSANLWKNWGGNDLVYVWETKKNPQPFYKQLCCPYFNSFFSRTNFGERSGSCYLVKKGEKYHKSISYFHPEDSVCLENLGVREINAIFNRCKYFYCYDPNCFYVVLAVICGCIPVIYPLAGVSKLEYLENRVSNCGGVILDFGMAWGNSEEEMMSAEKEILKANERMEYLDNYYKGIVGKFLEDICNWGANTNTIVNYYDYEIDLDYYRKFNEDLRDFDDIALYKHFMDHGKNEGRIMSSRRFQEIYPELNLQVYRKFNEDLKNFSDIDLQFHYHIFGKNEGRRIN